MTTHADPSPTTVKTENWPGVIALGLGIFALITAEFLPAGLLPRIAGGLDVSAGAAGQTVSVTAFAAAASALLISVVLPRADRRRVMLGLTLLAIASNLIVAIAPTLAVLLLARILLGIALGGFWAMATAMASHLVNPERLGRALTVINTGVALATVAAVPIGAYLGDVWGWRAVFVVSAGAAAIALTVQATTLPHVEPVSASSIRALGAVLRSGIVLAGLLGILFVFSGHFSGFTYIRPATETLANLDAGAFAMLLLVFGIANFLGTLLAGPIADRAPRIGLLLFPVAISAAMLLMYAASGSTALLFVAAAAWGLGFGGVPTTVLSWGARTEPTRVEQVSGVIVCVCNVAIAVGAGIGGALIDGTSPTAPLLVGAIAAMAGGLILTTLRRPA